MADAGKSPKKSSQVYVGGNASPNKRIAANASRKSSKQSEKAGHYMVITIKKKITQSKNFHNIKLHLAACLALE
ncbi:hypothetical protein QQ045_007208 [Rhodiola kirilowii]